MATYTSLLRFTRQADGENINTWGQVLNQQCFDLIDFAIAGKVVITTVGGITTLTSVNGGADQSRAAILIIQGVLASNATIVVPSTSKLYMIINRTTGGFAVTVQSTTPGSAVIVPQSSAITVACDGLTPNAGLVATSLISLANGTSSIGIPVANGAIEVVGDMDVSGALTVLGDTNVGGALEVLGEASFPGGIVGPITLVSGALSEIWGADVAIVGTTLTLTNTTGNPVNVSGSGNITSVVLAQGSRTVRFLGTPTLVDSANLVLQGGEDIVAQAGDFATFFKGPTGSVVYVLYTRSSGTSVIPPSTGFSNALVHVRDEKASGVNGGTFSAGARQTRVLNAVKTNEIAGVTLSSNQVVGLPAGTYYCEAQCPAMDGVKQHKAFLRDVTGSADLLIGTNSYGGGDGSHMTHSFVSGRFTLAVTSTVKLEHSCNTTVANTGFGNATSLGTEVYSDLKIWKL